MSDLRGRNADETVADIATWATGNVLETGEGTVKVDLDDKASIEFVDDKASLLSITVAPSDASESIKRGAGFVCDGVADEVEFNSAIEMASLMDRDVDVLAGSYNLSDSIIGKSNVKVKGKGRKSVIGGDTGANVPYLTLEPGEGNTLENFTIENLFFDGTDKTASDNFDNMGFIRGSDSGNLKNITIEKVHFFANPTVEGRHTLINFVDNSGQIDNLRIEDCYMINRADNGFGILIRKPNVNVWIQDNYIEMDGACFNPVSVYAGARKFHINNNNIICENGGHSPIAVSPGAKGEITGNYVLGVSDAEEAGIEVERKPTHGSAEVSFDVIVANNIIDNAYWGIMVVDRDKEEILYNIIIHDNIINNSLHDGIFIESIKRINIHDNTITGTGRYGISLCHAGGVGVAEQCNVKGNIISDTFTTALYLRINSCNIIGNNCKDAGTGGAGSGMTIIGGANNIIALNRIDGTNSHGFFGDNTTVGRFSGNILLNIPNNKYQNLGESVIDGINNYGSNANGGFRVHENGYVECRHTVKLTKASNAALEGVWTFPAPFISEPNVIALMRTVPISSWNVSLDFQEIGIVCSQGITNTQATLRIYKQSSAPNWDEEDEIEVDVMAIGT